MGFGKMIKAAALGAVCMSGVAVAAPGAPVRAADSAVVSKSVRSSAQAGSENELAGGSLVLALLAAAAVIAGIVAIADGGGSN